MSAPVRLEPEIRDALKAAKAAAIAGARIYPSIFCEYVLRDDRPLPGVEGERTITLAPYHQDWHREISEHRRLIIWSHIEAGKTSQIGIGRTLFEIGHDPSLRCVLIANTQGAAAKILRSISTYVERSEPLHEVFPGLRPSLPWTQTQITVERPGYAKDPTVQAIGVHGQIIGARIDYLIVDDILDWENTRTPQQREELLFWFRSEIVGRLTSTSRVVFIGNPYAEDDLLHVLASEGIYVTRRYPVIDAQGVIQWPDQWPQARIDQMTEELGGPGHPEVARQLYCVPRRDDSSRCQEAWILKCLERGEGIEMLEGLEIDELAELGATAHVGVDIGVKRTKRAAKTVVFVILSWPSGEKQIVWLRSGRWGAPQIVAEVLDARQRFAAQAHVEDNGAQDFILQGIHGQWGAAQLALDNGAPTAPPADGDGIAGDAAAQLTVLPFHTGGNKTHPTIGVESVFAELARGLWIIPSMLDKAGRLVGATPEIREWITEMVSYSPSQHTGDHLMASWIAKEGARLARARVASRTVGIRIIGQDVSDSDEIAARKHPNAKNGGVAQKLQGWEAILRADRK